MKCSSLAWVVCGLGAVLTGCGGGGGSTGGPGFDGGPSIQMPSASPASLTGVVAYGAPLANASVLVRDRNGKSATATTDARGVYTATVTGFSAPLLISASGQSGGATRRYMALLDSVPESGATATANVTPLTHAVVAMASTTGTDPDEFERDNVAKLKGLSTDRIAVALRRLQATLAPVLRDVGLSDNYNPMRTDFAADRSSPGDRLLDTVKVSLSEQGVTLLNARAVIDDGVVGDRSSNSVVIKGIEGVEPAALAAPTMGGESVGALDTWRDQVNRCLALPPKERATYANSIYTFLGACNAVDWFSSEYKHNGFSLQAVWGGRVRFEIPAGAVMGYPELLTFVKNSNGQDTALFRLAYTSSVGGGSYIETARNIGGKWVIEGNQRKYDAGVTVALLRQEDVSTNPLKVNGVGVGKASAYYSKMYFRFNQAGPGGADVYAVRIKGPGLPQEGLVFARSSAGGTNDYLAFYANDGKLPPATSSTPVAGTGNGWNLDAVALGNGYTGSNFYNDWRGAYSRFTSMAPSPVDLSVIPEFASYEWEVFTATSGLKPADTFRTRITTRPLAAAEGAKMLWASFLQSTRDYANPNDAAKAGEISDATLEWTLPAGAPAVHSAYLYGSNGSKRMTLDANVAVLGDRVVRVNVVDVRDGNGMPRPSDKLPALSVTEGFRAVATRQYTESGLQLQQAVVYTGRK